ncbi:hypothetical protein OIV83_002656 [Microbotryomycetes sp. JL201]|nr:hypothetical protein OIV83_002656 [Microbotryomycetes sp. JL201]
MRRLNLSGLSAPLQRASTSHLHPLGAPRSVCIPKTASTPSVAAGRRCSFSSSANGSNSRAGSGSSRARSPAAAAAGGTPKPTSAAAPAARSSSPSGGRLSAAKKTQQQQYSTPLAPPLPHATAGLVRLDTFFAEHRPLLELPIRLNHRRVASDSASRGGRISSTSEFEAPNRVLQSVEAVDPASTETAEVAEVVDLAEDGSPTGPAYRVMLGASPAMEPLRSPEEEREMEAREELESAEDHEAVLEELEREHSDPYDAWLLGEPVGTSLPPAVARYLASHPPFTPPSQPRAQQLEAPLASDTAAMTADTRADLSYLRPHSALRGNEVERSPFSSVFAAQIMNPLDPTGAKQQVDRFLSAASLVHRWHAQRDYDQHVTERMQAAEQLYTGQQTDIAVEKQDVVRLWSEKDGWVTINLKRDPYSSMLWPAELVDLDWANETSTVVKKLGEVALDSTKRKRKKKMTKHKYKKRRKAQRALRQRLGK